MQKRKIKCPFCPFHTDKDRMVTHIENKHPDMIPEGYTAARVLFNHINHKTHGTCVVCKRSTPWDENTRKYKRLCGRPECRKKLREQYQKNMVKVYGTDNILNDMEQQKKMLAHRKISGKYQFQDGTIIEYTGEYERKFLVFLDRVLGFPGYDIITPGPQFEYQYKGETHIWITDVLIVPYNLVIDVKDGGNNPNNRSMPDYRAKQIAKETMITNLGKYNYLRLTNNQFEQLIEVLYQLKIQMIDDNEENRNVIISINEELNTIKSMMNELKGQNKKLNLIAEDSFINETKVAEKIYNSISEKEKKKIGLDLKYGNPSSKILEYRKIENSNESFFSGFIDIYKMKKSNNHYDFYVLVAMKEKYLNTEIAQKMINNSLSEVIKKYPNGIKNFYLKCNRNSKRFIMLALSCRFKLIDTSDTHCVFKYSCE